MAKDAFQRYMGKLVYVEGTNMHVYGVLQRHDGKGGYLDLCPSITHLPGGNSFIEREHPTRFFYGLGTDLAVRPLPEGTLERLLDVANGKKSES